MKSAAGIWRQAGRDVRASRRRAVAWVKRLDARGTVLFCGRSRAGWDDCRPDELRRAVRRCAPALLEQGYATVLVEINTVFGFCALEELLRLRQHRPFTLAALAREFYGFSWLRGEEEQFRERSLAVLRRLARCDVVEHALTPAAWAELVRAHAALILDEEAVGAGRLLFNGEAVCYTKGKQTLP